MNLCLKKNLYIANCALHSIILLTSYLCLDPFSSRSFSSAANRPYLSLRDRLEREVAKLSAADGDAEK